nr:lipase, GDSL [Tanacetum cinerariifolium]
MVLGGSLSTHLLVASVRVIGKTRSTTALCDTPRMLNKLTISKTRSTCSWASLFFFLKKVGLDCDVAVNGRYLTSGDETIPYKQSTTTLLRFCSQHFNANSQAFSKKCSIEPGNHEFTYGANFASGGSGALNETAAGFVVDLQTQLQYFSDVANLYKQSLGQPGNTCNQEMNDIVTLHNQKLARKLKHLEKQLDGFMYSKFDISTAITNRMNNPSKYGFNDGERACCGSGPFRGIFSCGGKRGIPDYELCDNVTEFLFFDSLHPNEMAYRQFAELFWKGDPRVTGPYNLKALFDGKP